MFYWIVRNAIKLYFEIIYKIKVIGIENIPEGGAVLAANHLSNYDPLVLAVTCPRQVSFMAKSELFKGIIGKWFFTTSGMIPVKRGEADITAIKLSIKALKENRLLGIFVEGTRVKHNEDSQAKAGVAMLSTKSKKPVIPVYIEGTFEKFSEITITYGKAMNLFEGVDTRVTSDVYKQLSATVLDRIRNLKKGDDNAINNS
ncbi:MAG: lysophospholipid acyltransferase family protein [Clostridium sp.]